MNYNSYNNSEYIFITYEASSYPSPPDQVAQCCSSGRSGAKEQLSALVRRKPVKTSMLLVTGGAGFIGSNVVASLNEAGRSDIAVNDNLGSDGKGRNLATPPLAD